MLNPFRKNGSIPLLSSFPLQSYRVEIKLDHLMPGVDNVRHDVLISPRLQQATTNLIKRILAEKTNTSDLVDLDKKETKQSEKEEFKRICSEILKNVLKQANSQQNFDLFLLTNIAFIKFIMQAFEEQFVSLITYIEDYVKYQENRYGFTTESVSNTVQKVGDTKKLRNTLFKETVGELAESIHWLYKAELDKMLESLFGDQWACPHEVFFNPLLYATNVNDEKVLFEKYVFLGDREEDADRYEVLRDLVVDLFRELDGDNRILKAALKRRPEMIGLEKNLSELKARTNLLHAKRERLTNKRGFLFKWNRDRRMQALSSRIEHVSKKLEEREKKYLSVKGEIDAACAEYQAKIDGWISHEANIGTLFDYFTTKEECKEIKKKKELRDTLQYKKGQIKAQKRLFGLVYEKFEKPGLLDIFVASYEMVPLIPQYASTLNPRQMQNFLLDPKERRRLADQVKRFYPGTNLNPLLDRADAIEGMNGDGRRRYLIRFLKDFSRYHRDLRNHHLMTALMDRVNLLDKENIIEMSRINRTLYELLLPEEEENREAGITSHVVLKADVRGSTKITLIMNERGLNPASHFSMNFFMPISEILPVYDAIKIFVEGDAYILSIFEKAGATNWYTVARACGLAQNMLRIIKHYNEECIKNKLPILELGIGICFMDASPMFLFDGTNRIMISPALNLSDRLSSCAKTIRKSLGDKNLPFNLYVFQSIPDEEIDPKIADEQLVRYNVNGIQINEEAFVKLGKEISLRCFELTMPGLWKEKTWIHTGSFPTVTGGYQNLYIREAQVARVDPHDFHFIEWTPRRYFEVCTNPRISQLIEKMVGSNSGN
ncbi:MAG: hypothetical protein ACMUIL_04620 [bacterium]